MSLPGGLDASKIVAWYAARLDQLNDGDAVWTLTDQSGNGHTGAQAIVTRRATFRTNGINGLPVFRFVGSQFYKAGWPAVAEPYTVFVVFNPKALPPQGGNEVIYSGYTANGTDKHLFAIVNHVVPQTVNQLSSPPDWIIEQAGASQHVVGGTPVANTDYLAQVDYEATQESIIINGETVATGDAGHLASKGITVGAREDGSRFLNGDIAELVFCENLTALEKAAVSADLAAVYGVGSVRPDPIPPPVNTGDETEALQAKLDGLPLGGTLDLGGTVHRMDGTLRVNGRVLMNGKLDGRLHDGLNSARHVILEGVNPKVVDVEVEGPGSNHTTTFGWHAFTSYGATNPVFRRVHGHHVFGDAIYIGYRQDGHQRFPTVNALIESCDLHDTNRMGLAAVAVQKMRIKGGTITMPRQWCIDLEPAMVEMPLTDVMIDGVIFGAHKLGLMACTGYGARGKYGPIAMRNCKSSHVSLKDWPVVFATIPDGVLSRGPLTVTGNTFTHKGPGPVFKIETGWVAVTEPNTILGG